jgi:hypothetical protein
MKNYRAALDFPLDEFSQLGSVIFGGFGGQPYTLPMVVPERYGVREVETADGRIYELDEQDGIRLTVISESDHEIFDMLVWLCKLNILSGCRVPQGLTLFASEVLDGTRKRPTPRHREAKVDINEASFLYRYVKIVSLSYGLPITRNDVSPSLSACDAVSEAMREFGRPTSYTKIKDLMTHPSKKIVRDRIEIINKHFEAKIAERKARQTP